MCVFHNEPDPAFSPTSLKGVTCLYNSTNEGITGNAHRISKHLAKPDSYYIYCSDQERINWASFDLFCDELRSLCPDVASFDRGLGLGSTYTESQSFNNYIDWLCQVPFSETTFAYRSLPWHSQMAREPGMEMHKMLPTHSRILHNSVLSGKFRGLKTAHQVFAPDPLGSVTSGWTQWIPNIITCHLVFIKYAFLACSYASDLNRRICTEAHIGPCIEPFIKGLCNHMALSLNEKMYAGKRSAQIISQLVKGQRNLFTLAQQEVAKQYDCINRQPISSLGHEWIKKKSDFFGPIQAFKSTYPSWP